MSDRASGSHSARLNSGDEASRGSTHALTPAPMAGKTLPTEQPTVITAQPPLSATSQPTTLCTAAPEKLTPGMCLGQFELLEYVGGGGMGHVYRAMDTALGRPVALKVLSRDQVSDADTLQRFRNEARSAARLNHENIVQVYFAGEEQGIYFIAFEFIEGTNLRELVQQKGPLPLPEAIRYTLQIAEALAYASQQNVVHRDIKPSNVLITPEGRAKLIDMGLARLQGPNGADDLTASGVTLGTFDYISPEQARDPRNADVRSDIYSLGCTLFFMLAGQPPFPDGTVLQKLLQHQGDEPPDVRQFRPDVPEEMSRVVRRMMAKVPQQRYQEPARLIEALLAWAAQIGLQPAGPGQHEWVLPRRSKAALLQRHLPWLVPVVLLLGAVLLLDRFGDGLTRSETPHPVPAVAPAPSTSPRGFAATEHVEKRPRSDAPVPSSPKQEAPPATATAPPAEGTPKTGVEAGVSATAVEQASWNRMPAGRLTAGVSPPATEASLSTAEVRPAPASLDGHRSQGAAGTVRPTTEVASISRNLAVPKGRILIVDPQGASAGEFRTLKDACAVARNDDTIELRYNGRQAEPELPITLVGMRVTIQAAEGFQPVVRFQPIESDPVKYRRSMFLLSGGQVAMFNLALELSIPEDLPPDNSWTLFELDQTEVLEWKRCSLTIRNVSGSTGPYNPDVAFLRLKTNPFGETTFSDSEPSRRVLVRLEDCVVRGEAVFLRNKGMQPIDLEWHNGLLATSEWLLSADGSDATRANETMHVNLSHLTALVGRGLCQFDQEQGVLDELVNLHCSDSILLGSQSAVLIEQNHVNDLERARLRIKWYGDRNFYEGFRIFWSIAPRDASKKSEQLDFAAWQQQWALRESNSLSNAVVFKAFPAKDRPIHSLTPEDFLLESSVTNAALRSDNGKNAGLIVENLPGVPSTVAFLPLNRGSRPSWPELLPRNK